VDKDAAKVLVVLFNAMMQLADVRLIQEAQNFLLRAVRPLGPKNRQALKLLTTWLSTPDNQGTDWWADFERELADSRIVG
jgi:hypothetical protein